MMRMSVSMEDNRLDDRLRVFGRDAGKILNKVLRTTGNAYRRYMRRQNYLRGQMLGKRSGTLYRNVKVRKVRRRTAYRVVPFQPLANIYEHPGGADIRPKNAKVLRWFNQAGEPQFAKHVHLRARPFVSASYRAFPWDREIGAAANKVIRKELARRFGSG